MATELNARLGLHRGFPALCRLSHPGGVGGTGGGGGEKYSVPAGQTGSRGFLSSRCEEKLGVFFAGGAGGEVGFAR